MRMALVVGNSVCLRAHSTRAMICVQLSTAGCVKGRIFALCRRSDAFRARAEA